MRHEHEPDDPPCLCPNSNPANDLLWLTDGRIEAVFYCPPNDGRLPVLLIEATGGPKRYIRVWLDESTTRARGASIADWTWFKPDDAVRLTIDPHSDTLTDTETDDRGRQIT
jgi:hypothetical protein